MAAFDIAPGVASALAEFNDASGAFVEASIVFRLGAACRSAVTAICASAGLIQRSALSDSAKAEAGVTLESLAAVFKDFALRSIAACIRAGMDSARELAA